MFHAKQRVAGLRQTLRLSRQALALCGRAAPRESALTFAVQAASGATLVVQLLLIKMLTEQITVGHHLSTGIWLIGLLVLVSALVLASSAIQEEFQPVMAQRISNYALERILLVSSTVPLLTLETPQFQDRLSRAQEGGEIRSYQLAQGEVIICSGAATSAGAIIAVLVLVPALGIVLLIAAIPLWIATSANVGLFRAFIMEFTADRRQRAYLTRVLTLKETAHEVRAYDAEGFFLKRFARVSLHLTDEAARLAGARARRSAVGAVISTALTGVSLVVILYLVDRHDITGPVGITVIAAIVLASRGIANIALGTAQVRECSVFLADYQSMLASQQPAPPAGEDEAAAGPAPFQIEASHLSFRYPASDRAVLDDVSISLRQGQVMALIGRNGSGKTTLAKILCGLYQASSGEVSWDGRPVDAAALHARSTILFQDFARYMMSIGENIAVGAGHEETSAASVIASGELPALRDVIDQSPAGLDTLLGTYFPGGLDLSSGQWQRIAIARTLVRGGRLIILDEPGAFLDPGAEREVLTYARRLAARSAVLVISQNLENLDAFDGAYLMERGRIADILTADDLRRPGDLHERFA